jgi:hypothetical protein
MILRRKSGSGMRNSDVTRDGIESLKTQSKSTKME